MPKNLRWQSLSATLNREPLSPDLESRLAIDQLMMKSRMMPSIAGCGSIVILILVLEFAANLSNNWIRLPAIAILLSYVMMFVTARAWHGRPLTTERLIKFKRLFIFVSLCTSLSWGLALIGFREFADPRQQELLFGLAIGLISTAVFTGPLFYSLAFWVPVTAGCFVSFILGGNGPDFAILICLFVYALLTFFTMIFLDAKMAERAINAVKLEESNEIISLLLRDFQESSSDWLWETDERFVLNHASPRFAEVLHKPLNDLRNSEFLTLLLGSDQNIPSEASEALDELLGNLKNHIAFRDLVVPVMVKDERRWWSLTAKPVFDKLGKFIGYRGVGSDITAAQRSRDRIIYLARFDSLTNLVNRNEFDEVLQQACAQCEWAPFALLYLDLDDFKTINDTYGHATGDAVLSVVAERLRGCIRDGDIAGRLGGDEFAILVSSGDPAEACRVADRIIDRIGRPFKLDDVVLELGISIGIALAPAHGATAGTVSKNADLALYRAKLDGRGAWRLFNLDADEFFHDSRVLQMDLRRALAGNQFFLLFQPLVNLDNGRVTAFEALLRWRHPVRGLVMPSSFIPMAEQSGLIGPIGKWVIREVCAMACRLPRSVRIAINLSPAQLRDETLIDAVNQAIAETGVSPAQIEFEITESVNLITCGQTLEILRWVRERGIRVTIDDFGTGYSSMTLLQNFSFDKVKIDQSFIRELGSKEAADTIVKSMIELGHNLGMLVTAEGVETAAQVKILQSLGCGEAQGYLFAPPLPAEQLEAFIARQHLPA